MESSSQSESGQLSGTRLVSAGVHSSIGDSLSCLPPSVPSTLDLGVEPGPRGRAKLLLSRESGEASTRSRGSAGASPSRGRRTTKSSLDGPLGTEDAEAGHRQGAGRAAEIASRDEPHGRDRVQSPMGGTPSSLPPLPLNRRNAQAATSHHATRRKRLAELGIDPDKIKSVPPNKTEEPPDSRSNLALSS